MSHSWVTREIRQVQARYAEFFTPKIERFLNLSDLNFERGKELLSFSFTGPLD